MKVSINLINCIIYNLDSILIDDMNNIDTGRDSSIDDF